MALTRRFVFSLTSQTMIVLGLSSFASLAQDPGEKAEALDPAARQTLASFLDTLIPRDEMSPSAVDAGVLDAIEGAARAVAGVRSFFLEVCAWLDSEARKAGASTFSDLDEKIQIAIVSRAERSAPGTFPHRFFGRCLEIAFSSYYGNRESWPALGYNGPPQPFGFPDYTDAPVRRS